MIELVEVDKGFDVRLADGQVAFVGIAVQFQIGIRERDGDYLTVTLSTPFETRRGSASEWSILDPEADDERLGVLAVRLRRATVTECHVSASGTLGIEFDAELGISVHADDQYESWEIEQERFTVVSGPGGELVVWRRST
jgi:Family of unknown function (DUF6188)